MDFLPITEGKTDVVLGEYIMKKNDTYNTFYLYPITQKTQRVTVHTSGNISSNGHSITYNDDDVTLALTYRANTTPSKVAGVTVKEQEGRKGFCNLRHNYQPQHEVLRAEEDWQEDCW